MSQNTAPARGTARFPARRMTIGIPVNTTDARLGRTVTGILVRGSAWFTTGNNYTFVIVGL